MTDEVPGELSGAGVRLIGLIATPTGPETLRRSRGEAGSDDADALIASALDGAGMTVVADVVVAPPAAVPEAGLRRSRGSAEPAPHIEVDVSADETAVVLLEAEGGVFNWVFPEEVQTRRARGSGPQTLTFVLEPPAPEAPDRRSWAGALVNRLVEPVRVRVTRFAANLAIDALVERIEGEIVEGPVLMDGPAFGWVAKGPRFATPPTVRPGARVLLFVHGTFSTVRGSFSALEQTAEGKAFLDAARAHYDLVLGVDHRTLAADPEANSELFEKALGFLPDGTEIDAIGYSRGGLVLRAVVARLGARLAFRKLVFVGCTNAGTHLAEPENWRSLVDLYTSILVAGSKLLGMATVPVVATVTEQAIRLVAGFVKAMPQIGVEEGKVPGLAAMRPGSPTVTRLAKVDALGGAGPVHAIAAEFEPASFDLNKGMTPQLATFLGDRVVDRLFGTANDLVVDTASMADFGAATAAPEWPALLTIPAADSIYHVIYFATPRVADALQSWLIGQPATAAPPPMAAAPAPVAAAPPPRRSRPSAAPAIDAPVLEAAPPPDFTAEALDAFAEAPTAGAAPPPSPTPPEADHAACYFSAEMDSAPVVTMPVPLFVTVSPEKIVVSGHSAATDAPVMASRSEPAMVTVTALANCEVVGKATQRLTIPDDVARFEVRGSTPGVARVQVEIVQGAAPLASLLLEPVFLPDTGNTIRAEARAVPDRACPGNAATLRIYELRQQDGSLLIRYDLSGKGLAEAWDKVLPASFSMETFVGQFLGKLDAAYNQSRTEYKLFLSRITDFAVDSTNQLVPAEVRAALWEHRDRIDAVQVISDSPYMPWELLYIDDPAGGGVENRGFLAEWGLVRWMYNAVWPGDTIQLRGDRVRYVIPDYLNVRDKLPQATQEREMLTHLFGPGAVPVERLEGETHSESVNRFLSKNATECDLLHFACHGEAQQMAVLNSDLVLSGEVTEKGTIADDLLPSSAVKRRALFRGRDAEPSGLVFVNACQTGKPGEGISGVSGFADAFLRPVTDGGAAAFVGALWSVGDTLARTFADTFYARLLAGERLVDAVKDARRACQSESDFTWLAYTIYGNPFARKG